jgi:uncharacterized protein YjdB
VTGLVAPAATLSAEWPIFKLEVHPTRIGLRIGDAETLTVTATLTGNRTRNVTQLARYESTDPNVVRMPNETGNRSRIEGVSTGRATITVTDAFSSLQSSVEVSVGALERIDVIGGR